MHLKFLNKRKFWFRGSILGGCARWKQRNTRCRHWLSCMEQVCCYHLISGMYLTSYIPYMPKNLRKFRAWVSGLQGSQHCPTGRCSGGAGTSVMWFADAQRGREQDEARSLRSSCTSWTLIPSHSLIPFNKTPWVFLMGFCFLQARQPWLKH